MIISPFPSENKAVQSHWFWDSFHNDGQDLLASCINSFLCWRHELNIWYEPCSYLQEEKQKLVLTRPTPPSLWCPVDIPVFPDLREPYNKELKIQLWQDAVCKEWANKKHVCIYKEADHRGQTSEQGEAGVSLLVQTDQCLGHQQIMAPKIFS